MVLVYLLSRLSPFFQDFIISFFHLSLRVVNPIGINYLICIWYGYILKIVFTPITCAINVKLLTFLSLFDDCKMFSSGIWLRFLKGSAYKRDIFILAGYIVYRQKRTNFLVRHFLSPLLGVGGGGGQVSPLCQH